jgi:hypothetical protein
MWAFRVLSNYRLSSTMIAWHALHKGRAVAVQQRNIAQSIGVVSPPLLLTGSFICQDSFVCISR